ncbi:hypothetical protein FNO01nite_07470 [Flavobacterium noncentrifugens]|uniref:Outer membrane protein beta-barrel domain-containing protein n=1 Tax=Flavobacterium noncentrifugens TaxID=1128970 RepID=A0A1G8T3S9_9FLAO|nr:outer membrane beta-barrel protein [Flavobacterium noncentrifugens]GEP50075.1 hypothetical protein FNO01nite_07470 [Flavobacterium noncentrifugens]SDJ36067.1 Outer membrane protein beta-barrel domain-containing protein [Flavobacterium noncentrifugens]
MSEKKNIDKLFQEKFKDFEVNPPEFTWPELKAKLEKKKKRRIIPFWWQLSGVAAAFLIGFFVIRDFQSAKTDVPNAVVVDQPNDASQNPAILNPKRTDSESVAAASKDSVTNANPVKISNPENHKNEVANSEKKLENAEAEKGKPSSSVSIRNRKNAVANASENLNPNDEKLESSNGKLKNPALSNQKKSRKSNSYENSNSAVAHLEMDKTKKTPSEKRNGKSSLKNPQSAITESGSDPNLTSNSRKRNRKSDLKSLQTAIAESGSDSNLKSNSRKSKDNQTLKNQNSEITLVRNEITRNLNTNQALANENNAGSKSSETNGFSDLPTNAKQNAVAATEETPIKKTDSTAIAVVPNALEELLKEKEKKQLVTQPEPKLNRWQITSTVAPVYLGSTSKGSPIDSSFAGNSKNYGTNLSFGLGVNYAVTKKLKIRTGVNKVSLSYRTNDVFINAGLQAKSLPNVTVRNENQYLNLSNSASKTNKTEFMTDTFESYLNQKMGYIEVPVELSYAVLDKKFGIDIIGGLSTLFLNENEIQVVSSGYTTNFGEANNLNKTHFSTNIGLGLRYRFFKAFEANFNPMFKYQMDTFSKDNGNFKPYYFGLYTGLSFKF